MDWTLTFLNPWWLLLLGVVPLIVWQSVGSLAGLGRFRQASAILFRVVILLLLISAIADMQLVRRSNRLCTLFVLDQSQSVPADRTEAGLQIVNSGIRRRENLLDQAGLIVFGKNARIELPPMEYPREHEVLSIGSSIDRQYSDIGAGIKLALGSFPPDAARRIVLITDGNQNRGNAIAQAVAAQQNNVPVDVVPIEYRYDSEVLVDKIVLPPDLKKGDTTNLKVVIRSAQPSAGMLRLNRLAEGESRTMLEQRVELQKGLNVLFVKQTIDEPDFYTYEAQFEPDPDAGDRLARNNEASAFTWIRGEGKVLLVENAEHATHQLLVDKLRQDNIAVTVRRANELKENLAEIRQFDTVILANVPAEQLSEPLQEIIVTNTRELGAGLVMIGGEDSFGAGGYIGTPIEKALPVDMEIKATKVRGKGALVLIMHASEIPEGNFWQKEIAKLAIKMLGSYDECGLVAWNGKTSWVFTLQAVGNRQRMLSRVDRMQPGDMPDFDPSLRMAIASLQKSEAMTKHVVCISDGDPQPPSDSVLNAFKSSKITCTTVAVAAHGFLEQQLLKRIATTTGGRYYQVNNPKALPQIYIKETRVVSRPLIFERPAPWSPQIVYASEPVAGLPSELPGIQGFVLTTPKATAEVVATSPIPGENEVNPILAHWQYGLGKAVAFTSDTGQKWAVGWPQTELFAKFWSQLIRWSLRPAESETLSVSTQEKDGKVTVVVNAIDKGNEFLNFLRLRGALIGPDMKTQSMEFRQTEPGKYEAEFEAEQAGSYFLRMGYRQADGGEGFVSTGVNVSYPPEYRDLESNRDLAENLASISGGRVIEWDKALEADFFPHNQPPTLRLQDAWPWLLLASLGLFLFDVAVRRIAVEPREVADKAKRAWAKLRRRSLPIATETMERLRSRKAEVDEQIKSRRFETDAPRPAGPSVLTQPTVPPPTVAPPRPVTGEPADGLAPQKEETGAGGYTSRLLKAKKKVWEERDNPK